MSTNMGSLDRRLRGVLVAPAAAIVAGPGSIAGIVLLAVAAVTAVSGVCPLYRPLHIDTRGHRPPAHREEKA